MAPERVVARLKRTTRRREARARGAMRSEGLWYKIRERSERVLRPCRIYQNRLDTELEPIRCHFPESSVSSRQQAQSSETVRLTDRSPHL